MTEKLFKDTLLIQIVTVVIGVIGMVVDGAITGRCLGTEPMAAYGLVGPVLSIFAACASVCGIGTSVMVGRSVGARNLKEASAILSSCVVFELCFSFLLIAIIFPFSHEIASLFGAEGAINEMASDYLKGFCLCAPALLSLMTAIPIVQINGNGSAVVVSIVSMTAINITGDILNGYVIKAGLWGMALATTISYYIALVIILVPFFKHQNSISLSFKGLRFVHIKDMLISGLPNALQQICNSVLIVVLNGILLKISDSSSVAILIVLLSAGNLGLALGSGIGTTTSMLTGVCCGDEDDLAIRELMKVAIKKALLYDAVITAILIAGAGLLMPLFLSEAQLLPTAVKAFRLYCLSILGYSVNVTFRSYYQAMHFSLLAYSHVILNTIIFKITGALLLCSFMGIDGIWLSFAFGEVVALVALTVYTMLRSKSFGIHLENYLFIPKDFSAGILSRFDKKVSQISELEAASEAIQRFCIENGSSPKTAYKVSLAVEEIGCRSLAKAKSLEIRILSKPDCWTLRLRDDGKSYNPLKLFSGETEADFSYLGVKMLSKLILDMEYINTLNMNTLIIKINK